MAETETRDEEVKRIIAANIKRNKKLLESLAKK